MKLRQIFHLRIPAVIALFIFGFPIDALFNTPLRIRDCVRCPSLSSTTNAEDALRFDANRTELVETELARAKWESQEMKSGTAPPSPLSASPPALDYDEEGEEVLRQLRSAASKLRDAKAELAVRIRQVKQLRIREAVLNEEVRSLRKANEGAEEARRVLYFRAKEDRAFLKEQLAKRDAALKDAKERYEAILNRVGDLEAALKEKAERWNRREQRRQRIQRIDDEYNHDGFGSTTANRGPPPRQVEPEDQEMSVVAAARHDGIIAGNGNETVAKLLAEQAETFKGTLSELMETVESSYAKSDAKLADARAVAEEERRLRVEAEATTEAVRAEAAEAVTAAQADARAEATKMATAKAKAQTEREVAAKSDVLRRQFQRELDTLTASMSTAGAERQEEAQDLREALEAEQRRRRQAELHAKSCRREAEEAKAEVRQLEQATASGANHGQQQHPDSMRSSEQRAARSPPTDLRSRSTSTAMEVSDLRRRLTMQDRFIEKLLHLLDEDGSGQTAKGRHRTGPRHHPGPHDAVASPAKDQTMRLRTPKSLSMRRLIKRTTNAISKVGGCLSTTREDGDLDEPISLIARWCDL